MQPTRAMRARMAKQWAPGMMVDIASTNASLRGAVVVGPATTGDTTQVRVRFLDGAEEDWDASAIRSPRDHSPRGSRSGSSSDSSGSPGTNTSAQRRTEEQARRDEDEVQGTRSPRRRKSSHDEVVQRQQEDDAEASMVTPELSAWLQKRNLMHRAHVIAVSLEASGARKQEWVEMLDSLESDGETMFQIFMQAVEKKYLEDPARFGGPAPPVKNSAPPKTPGTVVVTVNQGGAGFVCAADLRAKKVTTGSVSAAAGLQVGMRLTGYSAGGQRHAMGGMTWAAFKDMCKQSPYPRVFTFSPAEGAAQTRSSSRIPEGVPADASRREAEKKEAADGPVSVTFTEAGSLGLKFAANKRTGEVELLQVNPGTQAARHPQLAAGLIVQSVAGASVAGKGYRQVLGMIKAGGRPVSMTFVHGSTSPAQKRSATAQQQAMEIVAEERNTTPAKLAQHLKECPDTECRQIVDRLKAIMAQVDAKGGELRRQQQQEEQEQQRRVAEAEAAEEEKEVKRAFAEAQAEAKRKEEEEAAAQAEADEQMRAREAARAKAEAQAAAAAAQATAEATKAKAAADAAAAQAAAEQAAAQEAKKAEEAEAERAAREAERLEQTRREHEARLKPSGPVNVYISPLIDPTEARREALAVRRMLLAEGVTKGTMRTVARADVDRRAEASDRQGEVNRNGTSSPTGRPGIPLAVLIESLTAGESGGENSSGGGGSGDVGASSASYGRLDLSEGCGAAALSRPRGQIGSCGGGDVEVAVAAKEWALVAARRGWGAVPLFPPGPRRPTT